MTAGLQQHAYIEHSSAHVGAGGADVLTTSAPPAPTCADMQRQDDSGGSMPENVGAAVTIAEISERHSH